LFGLIETTGTRSHFEVVLDTSATPTFDRADEEILNFTISDEALEAAAGSEQKLQTNTGSPSVLCYPDYCC
jgi:hypothetical protein